MAKVHDRGLLLHPRLFAGSVCDDSATEATYAACSAINETYILPFLLRFRFTRQTSMPIHFWRRSE